MKRFHSSEIETFLQAVDRHLTKATDVQIIGGAAAVLSLGVAGATMDIDLKEKASTDQFEGACKAARADTGLDIPVSPVGIWDAPRDFESRFTRVSLRGLKKLRVFVPEKYDWALMKVVRLDDKDIAHIKEAHAKVGFDKGIFFERFFKEMTHVEPKGRLITHFVVMMEELYGKKEADRMEGEIRKAPSWKSSA